MGAASLMDGLFIQWQKRRLVPRCRPPKELPLGLGTSQQDFRAGWRNSGGTVAGSRKGWLFSRDLSLGTWMPGSGSQVGCPAQPSGKELKALERVSGQNLETGPEKTSPIPSYEKVRGQGDCCNVEASRGHPGGLCGHMSLTVTAIPGESCGPSMSSQATEPWPWGGCRQEQWGQWLAAALAVDRLHGAAIWVEPGARAVGNWRADKEGAAGLDR